MKRLLHRAASTALVALALSFASNVNAVAEASAEPPPWLSKVAALNSDGPQAFQFRANVDLPGFLITVYVSWAPPNHRSIIFCDGRDGLPLMVVVDGDGWMYDLIGGQIVHYKSEPKFSLQVKNEKAEFLWGIVPGGKEWGIHADFGSFMMTTGMVNLKTTEEATARTLAAGTARGSKVILQVTAADPPLPLRLILAMPTMTPPGRIECDSIRVGEALPRWHHPLHVETLLKDVPYLDAADMKDVPKDKQELLQVSKDLLFGEASFLIRPALHDPALRQKLEQITNKLNFEQLELHEKLLKDAWLRALEHQGCEPAKSFPPLSPVEP